MPGRGRVEPRDPAPAEAAAHAHAALLGARMLDIGMNEACFWRAVPESVWECRIGGYQVLKKWLSYRDHSILARPLAPDEVAHVQQTVRRLAAILLLGPDLDAAHAACTSPPAPQSGASSPTSP